MLTCKCWKSEFGSQSNKKHIMKVILALIVFGVCSALADDAPYPPSGWKPQQRALLILPRQYAAPSNSQPIQEEAESLDKVSENVMERLKQEQGSDTGVYYVYLPDGKLQRVQYTTAPIRQQDGQQNTNANNYNQQQYNAASNYQQQYSQYRQNQFSRYPNTNIQSNHQEVAGTNQHSFQGNQLQFNRNQAQQQFGESRQQAYTNQYQSSQLNRYQPQQQAYTQYQGNQYLAPSASQRDQQQVAGNKERENGNPSQLLAQYSQDKTQDVPATSYVASVHFADVPPITGPIFSYSPSPLVRIVRYADNYQ